MTTVRTTCFVDCPFSGVIEFAEDALRSRQSITLATADDVSDRVRRHDALIVAWKPAIAFLFPDFRGALTVRPKGRGAWLRVQGSYEPPLGLFGRLFDAVFGQFIARLTLARLLAGVAREVECRWRTYRTEVAI